MNIDKVTTEDTADETPDKQEEPMIEEKEQDSTVISEISERRKALFEPLEPIININGRRPSAESLLPPPDFDSANYPRGWLIGKKRKLVNVDVVESMRRIAVQEMNRKVPFLNLYPLQPHTHTHTEFNDVAIPMSAIFCLYMQDREIDGLNQQLEGDAQCLEHLQLQLLQERSKRAEVERENAMLQDQISMLMNMLQDNESMGEEGPEEGSDEP
jgi:hypothetical protein